jgi:polysaccharide export outer membrane protein
LARDYLVDPEVIVEVVKQRSKKVYIMGSVKQPGYHEIPGDQRLLGTLLAAGGPVSFNTEARLLRLPKGDVMGAESVDTMSPVIIDLERLFVEGDQSQNVVLRDGDVLMVAEKNTGGVSSEATPALGPDQFYVVGSVANPGVYTYKQNDTVLDAVLRAGGFTEFASRNSTKVVRESDGKTRTFQVRMKDVMDRGEMDKNIAILPGDMIIVPESFF